MLDPSKFSFKTTVRRTHALHYHYHLPPYRCDEMFYLALYTDYESDLPGDVSHGPYLHSAPVRGAVPAIVLDNHLLFSPLLNG
jgi:hypothetical protein